MGDPFEACHWLHWMRHLDGPRFFSTRLSESCKLVLPCGHLVTSHLVRFNRRIPASLPPQLLSRCFPGRCFPDIGYPRPVLPLRSRRFPSFPLCFTRILHEFGRARHGCRREPRRQCDGDGAELQAVEGGLCVEPLGGSRGRDRPSLRSGAGMSCQTKRLPSESPR